MEQTIGNFSMDDLKRDFPVELANTVDSSRDISNKSENIKAASNLENLLAGTEKVFEKIYKDIGELAKLFLVKILSSYMTLAI